MRAIKHSWDRQGEKQKEKKLQREKNINMPKVYYYRKAGMIVFWGGFLLALLTSLLLLFTLLGGGDKKKEKVDLPAPNQSTMQPAIEYAKEFVQEYYTYDSKEDEEKRAKVIKPYFVKELREETGIELDPNKDIVSKVKQVDLKKVEEAGKNKGYITFKVETEITNTVEKEVEEKKKVGKKTKTVKTFKKEPKTTDSTRYITVPVINDNGKYAVYEFPKFTHITERSNVSYKGTKKAYAFGEEDGDIKSFLETFFETYASDSNDKIKFMLDKGVKVETLKDSMKYKEIYEMDVYKDNPESSVRKVVVDVKFKDDVDVNYISRYHIDLVKRDGRYIVKNFDENKK